MSTMFAHIEVYSRKSSEWRRSVAEVLAEARRDPGACPHIDNPLPPMIIKGVGFDELERLHDELVEDASIALEDGGERRLRVDTPSLYTAIFSHPVPTDVANTDRAEAEKIGSWGGDTIAWARSDIEARGGRFLSAVFHRDEEYPHLHVYGLHPSGRADYLHPGRVAKLAKVAEELSKGSSRKAANKAGNIAYRDAMRSWLNYYWREVGAKHGLTRSGPRRRRISRREWMAAQDEARLLQAKLAETEHLQDVARTQLRILDAAAKRLGIDMRDIITQSFGEVQ